MSYWLCFPKKPGSISKKGGFPPPLLDPEVWLQVGEVHTGPRLWKEHQGLTHVYDLAMEEPQVPSVSAFWALMERLPPPPLNNVHRHWAWVEEGSSGWTPITTSQ